MFKKGQLVRSKRTGNVHTVECTQNPRKPMPEFIWVVSNSTGRQLCVPASEMVLIGNNYKEKR